MSDINKFLFWHYLHPRFWFNWLGLFFMIVISLLPFRVIVFLGSLLGRVLFRFSRSRKHIVLRNLERCFPQWNNEQRLTVARQNFIATGRAFIETGIAWWSPARRLQSLVRCQGQHHLDKAVAENKRIILLTGHFCSLEIAAMYFASSHALVAIYKPPHNKLMDAVIRNRRFRFGQGTLLRVSDGVMPVIRALKRGEIFIYLPDQNAGRKNGIFVPFFGIQASTFGVLGKMTKLTNAVVLPCFIRQLPGGQGYELTIEPPLADFPSGDDYKDTLCVNTEIEKEVREKPDQYLWVHRRFKTRPEGEKEFY